MMIDFALEAQRKGGKNAEEAIYQACLLRFRPIMMTTMAALLGALAAGAGHRHRLGAAPAAGHRDRRRTAGQPVLTLYTTPVIYLYFDRLGRRLRKQPTPRPRRSRTPGAGDMSISETFIQNRSAPRC